MIHVAADLHVHTCLSPCAERLMRPRAIVAAALARGIGMIGVCDHNSAGNVRAVAAGLPACRVAADQELVDVDGGTTRVESLLLSMASAFSLEATVDLVHRHGGLALAAHVDRRSFSVPSQLGFIPPGTAFQALEVPAHGVRVGRAAAFAALGYALTTASDAHAPELVGDGFVVLEVASPEFGELARALAGADGRRCAIA
jgi:hypothetical protein